MGSTMSPLHDYHTVMHMMAKGVQRPANDTTFERADAAEARRGLESGEQFSKFTLEIG